MLPIRCHAQNYAWGRLGESSEVASLCEANGADVDKAKPYAELWMGTHPSGPSKTMGNDTLKEWVEANPECLGEKGRERFGVELPFLFKVLSVETALSIQSHPDKKLAEKLHGERPQDYKDPNHKPEMAIALRDFQALCSFVTHDELVKALNGNPELRTCVGDVQSNNLLGTMDNKKEALKEAFTSLMTCSESIYGKAVVQLAERLNAESKSRELSEKENLVIKLNKQYPGDIGVMAAFFLNLVKLDTGEAIYLPANEPHAYISGELVECMAASDNVVRAGLTPKLRDTDVLCSSLTYSQGNPKILKGEPVGEYIKTYRPPFDEFEVQSITIPANTSANLPLNQGPMVLLVQSGAATTKADAPISNENLESQLELHRGRVLFVPASTSLVVTTNHQPVTMWAACVNASIVDPEAISHKVKSNIVTFPLQSRASAENMELSQ